MDRFLIECVQIRLYPYGHLCLHFLSFYAIGAFAYWMFMVVPIWLILVIIQKFMILIWDNADEFNNPTHWTSLY